MTEKGKEITPETRVGEVVMRKGMAAAELMDNFFCLEHSPDRPARCAGTMHLLSFASVKRGKSAELPALIRKLNALPDIVNQG